MRRILLVVLTGLVVAAAAAPAANAASDCYSQPRGCVSVDGYFRSDGTYVAPYVRNYPGSGPASRPSSGYGYTPTRPYAPTRPYVPKLKAGYYTTTRSGEYVWHYGGRAYKWRNGGWREVR
jgi:hypothetical protein